MKVVSYLNSVPSKNTNKQKTELLIKYIHGVNASGDTGIIHEGNNTVHCDVGVIQGWVYENKSSSHLKLRNDVIQTQKRTNCYSCTADANLFLYANKSNPYGYLRYSFNGIFPTTGIYCDTTVDSLRWQQISKDTGIVLEPTVKKGKYIILMLQRQGGWSMKGVDVQDWAVQTITRIRQFSDRPILIRPHPGDKQANTYLGNNTRLRNIQGVAISNQGTLLEDDLVKAWAVVNYNSSSVVGPIIKGYHSFVTDPADTQCADVSHSDLKYMENPQQFDRQAWLERISMFHWKFDELENGSCWRHMRNYCQ